MTDISELFQDQPIPTEAELEGGQEQVEQEAPSEQFSLEQPQAEAPAPQEPKHVPLGALQEERARRQEYQQELERERQRAAQMEQRFQQMVERMQAAQQPPAPREEPIPAFDEDPAAHVAGLQRRYEAELAELRTFKEQQVQVSTLQQQQYQLMRAVQQAETDFTSTAPDYNAASEHYVQNKLAEYRSYGLDDGAARHQLAQDMQRIAVTAFQQGRNPAEFIYNAAKAWGYSGAPQQQKQAPAAPQAVSRAPNGQYTRQQPPASLATMPGSAAPADEGTMTLDKIASLSDAEFDRYWAQMAKGQTVMPKV